VERIARGDAMAEFDRRGGLTGLGGRGGGGGPGPDQAQDAATVDAHDGGS
jgi:hypothetical protein